MTVPAKCPTCRRKTKLVPHCENKPCGWWKCENCKTFGDTNGRKAKMPEL